MTIDLLKIRKISIFALFPFLFLKTICIFLSTLHTNPTDLPSLVDESQFRILFFFNLAYKVISIMGSAL